MWTLTSSALLASLLVIGSSLPRPDDSAYDIPNVGTGDRSQYYVLHSDGTFKYGYDTGEGAFESSMLTRTGNPQSGQFGYVDPDGKQIHLEYEAGVGGFVARGDHLPKPSAELAKAIADVVSRSEPFIDPLAGSDFGDKSYGFKFSSDDHSRNEQSDSDGTITGSYSYVDEFGHLRSFTYKAGKGIGFVIEGDSLTVPVSAAPVVRQRTQVKNVVKKQIVPARQTSRRRQHQRVRTAQPTSPTAFSKSDKRGDATYSFSYSADDHSRRETSDADLNVEGSFSFDGDDGKTRSVSYVAGSSTGFQAHGDHFPVPPTEDFGKKTRTRTSSQTGGSSFVRKTPSRSSFQHKKTSPVSHTPSVHRHSSRVRQQTSLKTVKPAEIYFTPPVSSVSHGRDDSSEKHSFITHSVQPSQNFEEANIRSLSGGDGSYSVYYDTSDHSRFESGDSSNNVQGEFSFKADDDGKTRKLTYVAGSGTGFIAEGDHLPVGPVVPGASSGVPTGRIEKVSSAGFIDPLADGDSDASYSFGFDSDTYSRTETSDSDGNVVGTYTIVDEDGVIISYKFKAGKGIGFETNEVSRRQGPKPIKPVPYKAPVQSSVPLSTFRKTTHQTSGATRSSSTGGSSASSYRVSPESFEEADIQSSVSDDGSYSFSYGTSSHSRAEHGDANNNVDGEFSFYADDDDLRKIIYEAGSDTGFIAEGAHIPVGPIVPGASSGQPTGRIEKVRSTPFVDPLARSNGGSGNRDASYAFSFDSDTYKRTESADENGNVEGTYDSIGDDGSIVTYKFKAGKGIGFQVEEIGRRPLPAPVGKPLSSTFSGAVKPTVKTSIKSFEGSHRSAGSSGLSTNKKVSRTQSTGIHKVSRTQTTHGGSSSSRATHKFNKPSIKSGTSGFSHGLKKTSTRTSGIAKPSFRVEGDDFTLRQYDPTNGNKFGYVIKYD